ncbi:hypothetical protein [Clostridium sp. HBUAS56010]|uniref:hypothetical protein n=1 Tax=Clostridium sp. HBUAS56010 TaxID=2571127 RepID=UPI00117886B6|nr:hypothetical protein [Clostridium sp. HBUAS56010]
MYVINKIKAIKPVWIILIICLSFILWIILKTGYFLPLTSHQSNSWVEWQGKKYDVYDKGDYPDDYVFLFNINKPVARDEEYNFLYSLTGDQKKEYNVLIMEGKDDHDGPQLCIQEGYEIPLDGEITGGILVNDDIFIDKNTINEIVELSRESDIIIPWEALGDKYFFYSIYLCFNNCPVSGKIFGGIWKVGDSMVIYRNADEADSSGEDKVALTFTKDRKTRKKLSKYIKVSWYDKMQQ